MQAAAWIELCTACWACVVAAQIFADGERGSADSAENRGRIEFVRLPSPRRVSRNGIMTLDTRVVLVTAAQLDGDHIQVGVIMRASGINLDANA